MSDPYEVIGVRPGAEPEVIDAAYRALMKKHHPDRGGGIAGVERAQQINAAYAAIRGGKADLSGPIEPSAAPMVFEDVVLTPPVLVGRRLAWTVTAGIAILAAMAAIATGRL